MLYGCRLDGRQEEGKLAQKIAKDQQDLANAAAAERDLDEMFEEWKNAKK